MLRGLHTEMAALKTIGKLITTRHARQVTACTLHILIHKAYCDYLQKI